MARLPLGREPAQAQNLEQAERRQRVLEVAAQLGDRDGFEHVQMTEIAKASGVAVGTLYRYFPSKAKLFEILLYEHLWHFAASWEVRDHADPIADIGEHMVMLTRRILARPRLAVAMIQCANTAYFSYSEAEIAQQQHPLITRILEVSGHHDDVDSHHDRAQLVVYAWWSVLIAIANNATSVERGEAQIKMAVRLILGPCRCGQDDQLGSVT
ncbi:TetR/AcrR family transcriptional regulator [Nocardioides immobilis]|uniref:TetR/AcrR family transcriptional regulator n=1 Tax=Nocardioides immobilis TaxID=2049295 RepID=UPI0015FB707B|nr:TetR/AcrR family transcriptional regulator [Nocardioides immobilis]